MLKIEPATGEDARTSFPPGLHSPSESYNRGKLSMCLDLKHPDTHDIVRRLCLWADCLCENFRPGVMDRLGFSFEQVRAWNPRLVCAAAPAPAPTPCSPHLRAGCRLLQLGLRPCWRVE